MGDPSRVGEARRHAAAMSSRLGFDAIQSGRLAVAVNELGNNLIRHATGGRLLLAAREVAGSLAIELLSIDDGPGMADLQACLRVFGALQAQLGHARPVLPPATTQEAP